MKAVLFLTGLLFILSSFASGFASGFGAGLQKSDVQNFRGSYLEDRGSAAANVWQLAGGERGENVSFDVFKENQQIRLVTPTEEFLFDEIPEFLLELDQLSWTGANAQTGGREVSLSLKELSGRGIGQSLRLVSLDGQCRGAGHNGDFFQNPLEACTNSGTLKFRELNTQEALTRNGTSLYQFLEKVLENLFPLKATQSSVTLKDFDLKVRNKSFDLKVKADLSISATIKAEGSFSYSEDRVRIKIDKVKASFLTITGKVFDELEKIQSPNFVVNRPYVTILF